VDGAPANTAYAGVLAEMFPDARFIHLTRNPDDVIRSLLSSEQNARLWAERLASIHNVYHSYRSALLAGKVLGREAVCRFSYERLINEPEAEMGAILTFLGEPFEANCLAPLAQTINQSQPERKEQISLDYSAEEAVMVNKLLHWFECGRDADWQMNISDDKAREQLVLYGKVPINAPPPDIAPGQDE